MLYVYQGSGDSTERFQGGSQLGLECSACYLNVLAGEFRASDLLSLYPLGQQSYMALDGGAELGELNAIAWYLAEGFETHPVQEPPGYLPRNQLITGKFQNLAD